MCICVCECVSAYVCMCVCMCAGGMRGVVEIEIKAQSG